MKCSLNAMIDDAKQRQNVICRVNKYDMDSLNTLSFASVTCFRKCLAELFRTDCQQQWTNDFTFGNVYFLCQSDRWKAFHCRTLEARCKLRDLIFLSASSSDYRQLELLRIDYNDSSTISYNGFMGRDTVEVIHRLEQKKPNNKILAFLIHVDQKKELLHLHVLSATNYAK